MTGIIAKRSPIVTAVRCPAGTARVSAASIAFVRGRPALIDASIPASARIAAPVGAFAAALAIKKPVVGSLIFHRLNDLADMLFQVLILMGHDGIIHDLG